MGGVYLTFSARPPRTRTQPGWAGETGFNGLSLHESADGTEAACGQEIR